MAAGGYGAIVMGASAGGTAALRQILAMLPSRFSIPIVVAQHLHPHQEQAALIAQDVCSLKLKNADEKEVMCAGYVYFAPPNYHLLIEEDATFTLSIDARVHYTRPSVDVLFESAADAFGARLVAVVLSGANADGADGLLAVKRRGGLTIVQDPEDAEISFMPRAAIERAAPAHVLTAAAIGKFLAGLR